MHKIVKTELYKLRHNVGFIILMLVSVIVYGGLNYMVETSSEAMDAMTQLSDFSFLIPIFAAVATASIVCDDYQLKTMKNIVSSGVSRHGIFFGKYLTSMLTTFLLLLLDAIVTIVICVYFKGFGHHAIVMQQLLINIVLQIVVVLIFNTFSFIFASLLKSSKSTIILSVILYLADGALFTGLSKLTHIRLLGEYSLTGIETNIEKLAMNTSDLLALAAHVFLALIVLLLTYLKFKKEEIK